MCFLSKGFVLQELLIISHFHPQDGWNALQKAARKGHHETCQILIKHGASVNAQGKVRDNLNFQKLCQNYKLTCVRNLLSEVGMWTWPKCAFLV